MVVGLPVLQSAAVVECLPAPHSARMKDLPLCISPFLEFLDSPNVSAPIATLSNALPVDAQHPQRLSRKGLLLNVAAEPYNPPRNPLLFLITAEDQLRFNPLA